MNKNPRFSLATVLLVSIGAALAIAQTNRPATGGTGACCLPLTNLAAISSHAPTNAPATQPEKKSLPKLLDLGAGKCIPCKMMFPVLDKLKKEYSGKLEVEFIDVWKNPDAGKQYGIEVIPTQIFYDTTGKELFRHIGFFGKEDILGKWKELGVELK
ncbi:MAG: thioredoxin family protein [Verrucomicrobiota bacterium]|jgi:thioredoxin 1